METVYLAMFLTGIVLATLTFLFGAGHAQLHIPHVHIPHLHLPSVTHPHPGAFHVQGGSADLSWFNVSTVTAFVAWFGGVGYLLSSLGTLPSALVLAVSALSGAFGACIVTVALVKVLLPGQTAPMRAEDYRLEGTLARVSLPLGGERMGEVIYTRHGKTCSEGARSNDGSALPRGTEVVILRYDKGIAYVEPLDRLLAERPFIVEALADERQGLKNGDE